MKPLIKAALFLLFRYCMKQGSCEHCPLKDKCGKDFSELF